MATPTPRPTASPTAVRGDPCSRPGRSNEQPPSWMHRSRSSGREPLELLRSPTGDGPLLRADQTLSMGPTAASATSPYRETDEGDAPGEVFATERTAWNVGLDLVVGHTNPLPAPPCIYDVRAFAARELGPCTSDHRSLEPLRGHRETGQPGTANKVALSITRTFGVHSCPDGAAPLPAHRHIWDGFQVTEHRTTACACSFSPFGLWKI
jgi:hypothetical protein